MKNPYDIARHYLKQKQKEKQETMNIHEPEILEGNGICPISTEIYDDEEPQCLLCGATKELMLSGKRKGMCFIKLEPPDGKPYYLCGNCYLGKF